MRRAAALAAAIAAMLALPALATAAPTRVQAWYMYGSTLSALKSAAYSHGCSFGSSHPSGNRLMLLDFGAGRQIDSNTYGALDFSGVRFSNPDILDALESAADGHHNCYNGTGSTVIAYGNSNYHMSSNGVSSTDAYNIGFFQSQRARNLGAYQSNHGYSAQSADAAGDMEPAWDGPGITRQLVNGDYAEGYALYYDYGSADGCPSSGSSGACSNGWGVSDVAYVSWAKFAVPLPEIYYTVNADQWTVVRRNWNANHTNSYTFWGTTGTTGVGLTPAEGWNALAARNSGIVLNELVCFC